LSQLPDTTDCDVRIEMPVFIHAEMNGYEMFIHIAKVYGLGNKSELLANWAQAALQCSGYKGYNLDQKKKKLEQDGYTTDGSKHDQIVLFFHTNIVYRSTKTASTNACQIIN
jgi:hypothetical protein